MSASSPIAQTSAPKRHVTFSERLKPFLAPYYLTVAGVLGAITVGFAVVFVLLILVVTNFNVLGWME
jgi:hypothetical protein